jgi:nitrate reductase (NAD(P)H)
VCGFFYLAGISLNGRSHLVSTALWTGVYLSDVLDYVKPIRGQAKHVVFHGGDSLPNGPYGTSQRLSWAANKEKGMLIGRSYLRA